MKTRDQIAKKGGLAGAGLGLLLFALAGLLQGSAIGGVMGLILVNAFFGEPATMSLLARVIVGASMLAGVIVAGIISLTVCSAAGWLAGFIVGTLKAPKEAEHAGQKTGA